jgi:hypothetical protein
MEDERNTLASLQYSIDESGEIYIDITLEDYSEEIIKKFATLLASVSTTSFQVQTLKVAQDAFMSDDKQKELFLLIQEVLAKQKLFNSLKESTDQDTSGESRENNDPLIKPTDLM